MLLLDCLPLKVKFRNVTNSEMSSKAGGKQVKFRNVTNSEMSSKAGGKQITFNYFYHTAPTSRKALSKRTRGRALFFRGNTL